MKRLLSILFASLLVLCGPAALAQEYVPTPVTISKEKVKLNGKVYLSHVVLERQTLYSICKAYGVSEEELYEANPTLKANGLQKNAILLVPFKEQAAAVQPAAEQQQQPSVSAQKDGSFTEHTVKWYEDIDDIARRYDVTVKDIMDLNGLKSKKLSTRQVLKIPVKGAAVEPVQPKEDTPAEETVEETTQQPVQEEEEPSQPSADSTFIPLRIRDRVEMSLVLPLKASGKASDANLDFYSGTLLALKDLEAEGIKVKANVYDLSTGIPPIDVLTQSDFVLGPIAPRELEAILQRVEGRVPVISPLDQKASSLTTYYRNFVQVPSAVDNQYDDLGQWVKDEVSGRDKVILITEKSASNAASAIAIRSSMARRELSYEILNYSIVEGRSIPGTLTGLMTKDGVNRVVVASESEAFMGDVVRNLGIMQGKGYDVVMYAPSRVRTFDTIEGSAYHDVSLHICTSYHADYSSPKVDAFVKAYRALFGTEPSQFAFQGYDTTHYFVARCARYGNAWTQWIGMDKETGLHTDFRFGTDANGNWQNNAVRRVVFQKDFTTTISR